jgi:hypothetical protein
VTKKRKVEIGVKKGFYRKSKQDKTLHSGQQEQIKQQ